MQVLTSISFTTMQQLVLGIIWLSVINTLYYSLSYQEFFFTKVYNSLHHTTLQWSLANLDVSIDLKSGHLHIQDTYCGPKCCICMVTNT